VTEVPVIPVKYPEDCCPTGWRCKYAWWEAAMRTRAGQKWWTLRCFVNELVDHRWFEMFIIVMIIGSSISLVRQSHRLLATTLSQTDRATRYISRHLVNYYTVLL